MHYYMRRHIKEYDTHIKIFFAVIKVNIAIPMISSHVSSFLRVVNCSHQIFSNFFPITEPPWKLTKINKKFKNYPVCWSIQTIKYSRTYKTYYSIKLIQHFIMRLQTQKYVIKSKRSPKNSASISPLLKSLIENPADQHIFFWQRNWINSISS